jgi:tetratricopeptide (TPR) repeat protein
MGTLAAAYSAAWKEDKAIALLEEVIRLSEAHLGPDHPETLRSRGSLAALFWRTNQLNRSVPLFEVVLKDQVRKLGADHPKTLATKANLGVNYRDLGRPGDALPLLEEAARHAREHDSLRWVGFPLAELYAGLGRPAEAAAQVKTNLEIARSTLPAGSPTLATELNHNATVLLKLGAWGEAEACLREALAIREKHGPDDWRTFQARSIVGEALAGQKRFTDAEPLLLAGARGLQRRAAKIPAAARNKLLGDALSRLVQMYDAWGKPAEVAQWQAKLDELKKPSPKTPNR